ncbi:MAG TPA: M20/M25/M40 family metallo-hydrolase [Candidatus Nitrosotenuis sp.]|nr:M20/M25/M40 family metallo-hydrolase [Candidatus Nitrosotenuis sp.]
MNESRLVDTFLRLVQVPGPTYEERAIADAIKAELASMGLQAEEDRAGEEIGGNAGNLIVNIPGNVPGAPALLFAAHMDTVDLAVGVRPQMQDGVIRSDGSTALGGDNRAGVAEILEAVREVQENHLPHGDLQLVFTVGEEGGLLGARALDPGKLKARYGYAVDVFKANQIYIQGRHLLGDPETPITAEEVRRFKETGENAPIIEPPPDTELTPAEREILDFTTQAQQDLGMTPEFRRLEFAGTDAIALRRHGLNAISLGAGENRPHSTSEFVRVEDMVNSTRLIRALIHKAALAGAVGGPVGAALAARA